METRQRIDFSFASVELLANGIVRVLFFGDQSIGVPESREVNNAIGRLSGGKPARVLIMSQPDTVFEFGAREFSSSAEGQQFTLGDALVIHSLPHKLLANFYLKFDKPPKPSKAFDNEADATAWLLSLNDPAQ